MKKFINLFLNLYGRIYAKIFGRRRGGVRDMGGFKSFMMINGIDKKKIILCVSFICLVVLGFGFYSYAKEKDYFTFVSGNEAVLDIGNGNEKNDNSSESGKESLNENKVVGKEGGKSNEEGKDDILKNENENENENVSESENNITDREKSGIKILVHVQGAVNRPGLIECFEGNRIADVIEKAGGLKSDANLRDINLAEHIVDGMKIYIPCNGEINSGNNVIGGSSSGSGYLKGNGASNSSNNSVVGNFKVNINKATQTELETIPGVGPSTALKIIAYRKEKGRFTNINQLKDVTGIGDVKFEKMRKFVEV